MSTETPTPSRTVDGITVPQAGTYVIDASHTDIGFKVRHMGVGKVRGKFTDFSATFVVAEDPLASTATVEIAATSFHSGNEQRDGHVIGEDFLDSAQFPQLTYQSTGISALSADGSFTLEGTLTIRGVAKPVALTASFDGALVDPWGGVRFGFSASTRIDREDFGLTWNQALEAGGLLVGKSVDIEIDGEATLAN